MKPGATLIVPELPGSWSIWSLSDECPGAREIVTLLRVEKASATP